VHLSSALLIILLQYYYSGDKSYSDRYEAVQTVRGLPTIELELAIPKR
jgi:hypothetical protein